LRCVAKVAVAGKQAFEGSTLEAKPFWLGLPTKAQKVVSVTVSMKKDALADVRAEGEASVFRYPLDGIEHTFKMFATMSILVFPSSISPPDKPDLSAYPFGGTVSAFGMGRDIGKDFDYYYPASRIGTFTAPADGDYTFVSYWWGGAMGASSTDAGLIYPGTAKITVLI
jgi:hypothetical protein